VVYSYLSNLNGEIVSCGHEGPAAVLVWLGLLYSFSSYRHFFIATFGEMGRGLGPSFSR
jgi:hypothetical protein